MGAARAVAMKDPYAFDPADIEEPPRTLIGTLRRIGPGMLLSAAIVGTGELIATTRLGAEFGFTMLWAILFSCIIKTIVQAVWGRYTIATGETGLAALNRLPGPRWLNVNWAVWAWALMIVLSISLIGAMFAGSAQVLLAMWPALPQPVWVVLLAAATVAVLLTGQYRHVELLAVIMVGVFTLMTVFAASVLMAQPQFSWAQVGEGLTLSLPDKGIIIAVTVFGLTGVNSGELSAYPYWCIEKGYARYTGARQDSDAWRRRAAGWIRVMHWDIFVSMLVYTLATVAFYFLGAGVLHTLGQLPKGDEMIQVLSKMYTQTLGEFGLHLFYVGALFVLYSTIFAATAANSRIFADMLRLMGVFQTHDYAARLRYQRIFVIALIIVPCLIYFWTGEPLQMVKAGGIVLASMLPVIAIAVVYLRHKRLPADLRPSALGTLLLWLTTALIVVAMTVTILMRIGAIKA